MIKANDNFRQLPESYLFSEVGRRVAAFRENNPDVEVIRMDIGDVTRALPGVIIDAMHKAVDDLASGASFHGYGPEQGYLFLREAIALNDYSKREIDISPDEIFISDGAKSDLGNLGDIYSVDCKVAVMNPAYPVYVDDSVIDGRAGSLVDGRWSRLLYLGCDPDNGFLPSLPTERPDVIFLCFPNNPTGVGIPKDDLSLWVDYARKEGCLIIYDSAYESFVTTPGIVRSIYEVDGADEVAIEVRSFSKTAGFTGVRCGYTVVPKKLKGRYADGSVVSLNTLWNRRQSTKFNGASYISQRAAQAVYTPEGIEAVKASTDIYCRNASLIRETLAKMGWKTYGGIDSPYVWANPGDGRTSWEVFDSLLNKYGISTTPGSGFGTAGEGYVRFTGFNTGENTLKAMRKIAGDN